MQGPVLGACTQRHHGNLQTVAEEPILTSCWNCFFDLLFIAFVTIIKWPASENRIPLPDCKLKCLCSEPRDVDGRKEEMNTSSA